MILEKRFLHSESIYLCFSNYSELAIHPRYSDQVIIRNLLFFTSRNYFSDPFGGGGGY